MIFKKNTVKRSIARKISNGIIGFFVSLFILLAIIFAFSQTSTFRNILREEIIELADNSLNGKLNIEAVEGTIITQLLLKNVSLENNSDTLLNAQKIEIAINPFYILAKRIKITKLNISDAQIALLETSKGNWNIDSIIKSDSISTTLDNDSLLTENGKESDFPLLIDISNFSLKNISLKIKNNKYLAVHKKYESMNFDDIEIDNFNLELDLLADINKKEFFVDISELSFSPNLSFFKLNNLNCQVLITEKLTEVKNLNIVTDSSAINLSARLENFNLFGNLNLENFKDYPLKFNLTGQPFSMSDLSSFIESTNFMHGKPLIDFEGKGKFGDFDFTSTLNLDNTSIKMEGNLTKLETPSNLYIKAKFSDSDVAYNEIDSFLSGLELPNYPDLFVKNLNINYEGEPLKFKAEGGARIGEGNFTINAYMDITKKLIEYDYKVETHNLNLKSTLGINSRLNTKGSLAGSGFDPEKSNSSMSFVIENSNIEGYNIDSADIKLQTIDKLIDLSIFSKLDSMKNEISGKLDLANTEKPIYNLKGNFENLNLFNYTKDSTLNSSLNFVFDINGHSLDLDKTEGQFELDFINSRIGSNDFDSINFLIDLSKIENTRLISFQSDILDFNITGDFLLDETFNLLNYQASKISYAITEKLTEINPVSFTANTSQTLELLIKDKEYSNKNIYLDYDFDFKDFKLIAALLNRDKVEISGKGYGFLENDSDNFTISTTMNLDWLFLFKGKEVFYISGVESSFDIGADNNEYSFDNIFGSFALNSEEMVSDLNINNIKADLIFNQSKAFINAEANIQDEFDTGIEGYLTFSDTSEVFNISNLFFSYKDYKWQNKDSIYIVNSPSKFNIENFNLFNEESKLNINGYIQNKNTQNIDIILSNLHGGILANKLFDSNIANTNSNINLTANIGGTTASPIHDINFSMSNLQIKNNYIGSLIGTIDYKDKNLETNIEFFDSLNSKDKKILTLVGNIPINLGMDEGIENIDSSSGLNLNLKTNGFNLASFGDALPTIKDPEGEVNSDISIFGKIDDFNLSGYLSTNNLRFTSTLSNLDYFANINFLFDKKVISIVNSYIKNEGKTNFPGHMVFSGQITTDGFAIKKANLDLNGELAVLSPFSRVTSPNFYGDLQLKSENDWNFSFEDEKPSFTGSILLNEVNLSFIPSESSYSVTNSDFRYIFTSASKSSDIQKEKRDKLLSALSIQQESNMSSTIPADLNLDIKIKSENISKISVVLSKTLNQKLLADITGELRIKNINNTFSSHGQFDILPSSMFTFYKTFGAKGNIKFTSDLTNPIVNITSTYISDYINPRYPEAEPIKTAVKIKIDDSAKSLLTNIASGEKPLDMKIYSGAQNIEYDVPNPQYTNLDAMYFIIFGTFSNDTENTSIAKSAGYSMLGSAITSGLNAQLGNLVNNVNINKTGDLTRVNISGRYQQFRYSVGSSYDLSSQKAAWDLSQANAKVEYLFSQKFIMRVERKDPVISTDYGTKKINEFGVMYRFTF
jgi:AsmA-like protein